MTNASLLCSYTGPGLYECECKDGYSGDGVFCTEVNPCLNKTLVKCDENAVCHHVGPAVYNCICQEHYTGDGKTCRSVDACSQGKQ